MHEYTSESRVRHPLQLVRQVVGGFRRGYYFAFRLFISDVLGQKAGLKLGNLWKLGEPIVYAVVFVILREGSNVFYDGGAMPASLFVLYGIIAYHAFSQTLVRSMNVLQEHSSLMNQVKIPSEALVLTTLMKSSYDFIFSVPVVIGLSLYCGIVGFWNLFASIFVLYLVVLFALPLGILFSPFSVIYKDFGKLVSLSLRPMMFVTPVFYNAREAGVLGEINGLFAFSAFLDEARSLVVTGQLYNPSVFVVHIIVMLVVTFVSVLFFNLALPVLNRK